MQQTHSISLTPVIELIPQSYADNRPSFTGDILDIEARKAYNQACYRDAGLEMIEPVEKGSWLFEIEYLSAQDLKIIFTTIFNEAVEDFNSIKEILDEPIDYAPFITGGFLLRINDEIKSRPGCCCGLESISDWESAVHGAEGEIWTGHDKDDLVFLYPSNDNFVLKVGNSGFELNQLLFQQSVSNAKNSLTNSMKRISPILNEILGIKNGAEIISAMIYK